MKIGARGFVTKATLLLLDFDFRGRPLKGLLKELSEAAQKARQWLWLELYQRGMGIAEEAILRAALIYGEWDT